MSEQEIKDMLEMAWVVIANASEGNWDKQTDEWTEAATKWRDYYFRYFAVTS